MSPGSRQQPARRPDAAREVAWELLRDVDELGSYANLRLPQLFDEHKLNARDRAFATELGYGTLRALGTLDVLIDRHTRGGLDPAVRDALRLGAYQIWRTRVPDRAAVSTTVDLVRSIEPRASRLANAVMRRIVDDVAADDLGAPAFDDDPAGHLAVVTAHPRWIVEAFADVLGVAENGWDETRAALLADDERPEVHLVARRMERDELLADAGEGAEAGPWSETAVRLTYGGDPGEITAVRDGRAAVQDEGSQLVALALAAVVAPGPGVVDLAAGPGGKGALLAARGLSVVGLELHLPRARLVAGAHVPVAVADSRQPPLRPASADRVLLDAPCTGLGALRRRPEARWRRTPGDLAPLAALQRELLASALRLVRPGGVVAYVTCSPHRAETVDVVDAVRADPASPPTELLDARAALPAGMPGLGDGPTVQLWPHRHGTDAMFLA
ncbi:MAG: rRNA (cytosine967-C5)-methyltransferase, partial [Frankiaceae bacterium]|nr:rRNA (cytosine967-C5)-methyltransferase [Frankiaceae bacterium]